ncbi:hypothetical protein AOV_02390 [Anaplasma ovis str. Haibei]|uniref:Uncharacterized protein n=1 Tax=Anaplasma ovis str. Haibei TaxID=1248439 RepID=A0A2Z2LGF6_9RICK|nr:hypothetical protein AOV_02390 [Anaplasma ovis str. Haibei]
MIAFRHFEPRTMRILHIYKLHVKYNLGHGGRIKCQIVPADWFVDDSLLRIDLRKIDCSI